MASQKLKHFDKLAAKLYEGAQSTALHSLEALVGMLDFDRLGQCKRDGGMLASPSSTAAYLMNVSKWDSEAEQYLHHAFNFGTVKGTGGIASAYPMENFEISCVCSTLLEAQVNFSSEDIQALEVLRDFIEAQLAYSNGIAGFSHGILPDADDTAKCLQTLQLLGRDQDPSPLIAVFQTPKMFKTYLEERTPSLSTNCNVLKALLALPTSENSIGAVGIALRFICDTWFAGRVSDTWNTANEYVFMSLAQGLCTLIKREDIMLCFDATIQARLQVVGAQVLSNVLCSQALVGSSARESQEVTAYCGLTLIALRCIPTIDRLAKNTLDAIEKGREYLRASEGNWISEPIWIEKTQYHSRLLTDSYCVAALGAKIPQPASSPSPGGLVAVSKLFSGLSLFSSRHDREFILNCAMTETQAFQKLLQLEQPKIFPRSANLSKEKYLTIVPFAWTACNRLRDRPVPANILLEMMMISFLNFQADEFFEVTVTASNSESLRQLVDYACEVDSEIALNNVTQEILGRDVVDAITASAAHIIHHPCVRSASSRDQAQMRTAVAKYLHAQITSNLNHAPRPSKRTGDATLFQWVRTSGAVDTSAPYSFMFHMLLSAFTLGIPNTQSEKARYVQSALFGHVATLCPIYNDYGSLLRDRDEGNLNCVDFFQNECDNSTSCHIDVKAEEDLMRIASFERSCMDLALAEWREAGLEGQMLDALELIVDVTELHGQIYVVRDIGTETKGAKQ